MSNFSGRSQHNKKITPPCVPPAGLQGEEHGPHAPGHRRFAEEQQERLHLRADGHRPVGHVPLGGPPSLLQGPGGLQRGWEETHAEEDR